MQRPPSWLWYIIYNSTVSYWSLITSLPSLSFSFPFCPVCSPFPLYSHPTSSTTVSPLLSLTLLQPATQIHTHHHHTYMVQPLHLHTARNLQIQQVLQPVDPTGIKNLRRVSVLSEGDKEEPPASASQPSTMLTQSPSTGNPAQRS